MRRLFGFILFGVASALVLSSSAYGQNLLINGDFEASPNPGLGFYSNAEIPPWRSSGIPNGTGQYDIARNPHTLVQMDGPGGYPQGPSFPESDASAPGAGIAQHYLSIQPYIWQYVTPSCDGTLTFSVSAARMWNTNYDYTAGNAMSIVPVASEVGYFSHSGYFPVSDTQAVIDLIAAHDTVKTDVILPLGQPLENAWFPFSTQAGVQAGQTYAVMLEANSWSSRLGYDNASATLACAGSTISPGDVTLFKTCEMAGPHTNNGILGQRWDCQVDVTTASTPFSSDIILHDLFTDTQLVTGEILLGESVSGNGSCFAGDCLISGADFDASGTESFTFDVFIEAVGEADVYPLENCVTGEIDDGSGTMQPLTPNCTTGQWIPRSEVVKTCDPIPENASAPYTLNCQIDVTASGLVGGTYVTVMDAFAAQPPSIATVTPTFMNVTSSENWDCIDHQINTPSSIGICELPAEDLMAAGGTSTLDISFQFDVDQTPTQVANCRFTDIHDGSYLAKLSGLRSSIRSPIQSGTGQNSGWPQMPDGCVYVDVPAPQLETKVETQIKKQCDQPHLTQTNGTWGYLWQCEAEISVTPSPFAGTVSFVDDGSQISMGTASFISVSDPNNCQGLQTAMLNCSYPGATFASPHHVQYDLFTPYIATDEEITWKNCIEGQAATPAGSFPSVPMCVGRTIKPTDIPDLPPLKESNVKKSCGAAYETEFDGEAGIGWDCEIKVTAHPAPFAGTFTFTEDASAITGSTGQIIDINQSTPANWNCTPSVPTQSTDCTISGANFDNSGIETVGFSLFAPNEGKPITWQNCVTGLYRPEEGEPRDIKGNCEGITWEPPLVSTPPEFSLKKGCQGPFAYEEGQRYICTIYVTQTGGDPVTQPLTLEELFSSTTSGQLATQYLMLLQGSAGWNCDTPSASCTIQPSAFNGVTGHQISGIFLIPNSTLAQQDFENCAALNMGDEQVATASCVSIDEPAEVDIEKECKPVGDRQILSDIAWFQQWQCDITVTSGGAPFTDPLWVDEDMLYGSNNGNASIVSMTSSDPWQCTQPVYGTGNQPVCGMDPAMFPYSAGQSTITVTLNLSGAVADQFGAENCVALSTGKTPSDDPADILSEDCFEILPPPNPKEPEIDLVKTCEPATQGADGQWTVACTLTLTGQNLPAGEQLRVMDELMSSSTQTAVFGQMTAPTNACGGGLINGGAAAGCDLTTDDIINAGGTLTIPYTGTYQGPGGRPLTGAQAQNCAYVDVPSLNLHGPQTGNGKSCVPVEFKLEAIGGPIIDTPVGPLVPSLETGSIAVPNLELPSVSIEKTCAPLIFAAGAQTAQATCQIAITSQNLVSGQLVTLVDALSIGNAAPNVPIQGPFMTVINSPLWACSSGQSGGTSTGQCIMTSDGLMSLGNPYITTWTATVLRDDVHEHRGLKNCATLTLGTLAPVTSCAPFEVSYKEKSADVTPATPAPSTPAPPPPQKPSLAITKTQTSACRANRASQTYDCGFRLNVTNTGTAPYVGPLTVTDTVGSPGVRSSSLISAGGWTCAGPVGNAISCENQLLNLAEGASTHLDLSMKIKALRQGGDVENCGALGIPADRTQRVAAIQQVMNARGLNAGPVDGKSGKKTYAALAELQTSLGLPVSTEFDDALFAALGLPLQTEGAESCVYAPLPAMPAPPLQCNPATTVKKGESCACRYDNMQRRNATSCQCSRGFDFVSGEGCIKRVVSEPVPVPAPVPAELVCDKRSTRARGGECVCIDQNDAVKTSSATCGCKNGGPMIAGRCLSISATPGTSQPDAVGDVIDDVRDDVIDIEPQQKCKVRLNGICIK